MHSQSYSNKVVLHTWAPLSSGTGWWVAGTPQHKTSVEHPKGQVVISASTDERTIKSTVLVPKRWWLLRIKLGLEAGIKVMVNQPDPLGKQRIGCSFSHMCNLPKPSLCQTLHCVSCSPCQAFHLLWCFSCHTFSHLQAFQLALQSSQPLLQHTPPSTQMFPPPTRPSTEALLLSTPCP